jgi:tetratricopeptide (TPR) repeat protein
MSSPSDTRSPRTANTSQAMQRLRGMRMTTWVLLGVIFGSCTVVQGPREVGRWHMAKALNLRSKGDKDAAYQELQRAIDWFPKNPELVLHRAEWRLDDGERDEAFADCDKMLEMGGSRELWLKAHGTFLQNASEFVRAVEDWKKLDEQSRLSGSPSRPDALNGWAYAQALADVELDDALEHVNEALELVPESERMSNARAAMLDTRGFIFHLQGKNELALADLNRAIKVYDVVLPALRASLKDDEKGPEDKLTGSQPKSLIDADSSRATNAQRLASHARSIAVVHYHRALILAALGRQQEADADRAIAKQLIGREPDETLF